MKKVIYKKYSRNDQKTLATWAAKCAERVLPLFEKVFPDDPRPREAIKECRTWVRTGIFKMSTIRAAALGSHVAARHAQKTPAACFAARAAGHAVGTAHVTQHSSGSAYYALKAIAEAHLDKAEAKLAKEIAWQSQRLPPRLRDEIMNRIVVKKQKKGFRITIKKAPGF